MRSQMEDDQFAVTGLITVEKATRPIKQAEQYVRVSGEAAD